MRAITDEEQAEFTAITSGEYDNFVIVSTEFDGEETVAIAALTMDGDEYNITPLYIKVTDAMFERMVQP